MLPWRSGPAGAGCCANTYFQPRFGPGKSSYQVLVQILGKQPVQGVQGKAAPASLRSLSKVTILLQIPGWTEVPALTTS